MAAVFYYEWFDDVMEGLHTLGSDTLKCALSNTAPVLTDDQLSDVTQITAANGYSAGGTALTTVTSTQTTGTYSLTADDVVFTASGGAMGQFRYAIIYNDDATNDELILYHDKGSAIDLADGETCTVDFTTNVFTFTTDA